MRYAYIYSQSTGKPNNLKVPGERTSNDLNRIYTIRNGHLCLRDENLILFVRYDVRIQTMFGSSLPQVGCRRVDVLFGICVCLRAWCSTRLDCMSNMADVIYKRQELITVHEHLDTFPVIGGVLVAHHFSFLCFVFFSSSCVICIECCQFLWNNHS